LIKQGLALGDFLIDITCNIAGQCLLLFLHHGTEVLAQKAAQCKVTHDRTQANQANHHDHQAGDDAVKDTAQAHQYTG
jgi:hypothetical protein